MRPLDYSDQQPDGLYARCLCGAPWTAHERGICPYNPEVDAIGGKLRRYRPYLDRQ